MAITNADREEAQRLDRASLLKFEKDELVDRIYGERQRASKAIKARDERKAELEALRSDVRELEAWKQRAEKLLLEMNAGAEKLLSRDFKRLLRGPKVRKKRTREDPPTAVGHVDVRLSNFLPDTKPGGSILRNPGPFRQ